MSRNLGQSTQYQYQSEACVVAHSEVNIQHEEIYTLSQHLTVFVTVNYAFQS